MKRTRWFPVGRPPVRRGWYEWKFDTGSIALFRMWWDGKAWRPFPRAFPLTQNLGDYWRGLTERAK